MTQEDVEGALTQRAANATAKMPQACHNSMLLVAVEMKDNRNLQNNMKNFKQRWLPKAHPPEILLQVSSAIADNLGVELPPESTSPLQRPGPSVPKTSPLLPTPLQSQQEVLQRITEMLDSKEAIRISLPKNVTNAKLRHQVMPVTQARL